MARYNHFTKPKYKHDVCFGSLTVGEKFRMDKFKNGIRREGIIMVKTSDLSCREVKSKKEFAVVSAAFDVALYQSSTHQ